MQGLFWFDVDNQQAYGSTGGQQTGGNGFLEPSTGGGGYGGGYGGGGQSGGGESQIDR